MQGFQTSRGGNGPAGMTSLRAAQSGTGSSLVALTSASNRIKITNYDSTNPLFVDFYGVPTTASYAVAAGKDLEYDGPAISNFRVFSNNQSVVYGVFAY